MIQALRRFLQHVWVRKAKPKTNNPPQTGYTKEEARKVKERLQGLGYLE